MSVDSLEVVNQPEFSRALGNEEYGEEAQLRVVRGLLYHPSGEESLISPAMPRHIRGGMWGEGKLTRLLGRGSVKWMAKPCAVMPTSFERKKYFLRMEKSILT